MTRKLKIGAGYNPALLTNSLVLPPDVQFIEFGLAEYEQVVSLFNKNLMLSLHIARSPISEDLQAQRKYIKNLKKKINSNTLCSIGFHLSGERNKGIGRFGFTSPYIDNEQKRKNVIQFIKILQDTFQIPIWIENANFYSSSLAEITLNIDATSEIIKKTEAQLILDLTHLYIDIRNAKGKIIDALNRIPWSDVAEIHLSGMVYGKNDVLHDGHNHLINDEIWSLFTLIDENYLDHCNPYVTIEHTDISWSNKPNEYLLDFDKLSKILKQKINTSDFRASDHAENYARHYLHKVIEKKYELLKGYIEKKGLDFYPVVNEWINKIMENKGCYLVLNKEEMLDEDPNAICLQTNFRDFIRSKFK